MRGQAREVRVRGEAREEVEERAEERIARGRDKSREVGKGVVWVAGGLGVSSSLGRAAQRNR